MSMTSSHKNTWNVGFACAALSMFFGMFLPCFEYRPASDIFVNAVWDPLYGVGFEIGYAIYHEIVHSQPVATIAIAWILIVFVAVAYAAKEIASSNWSTKVKYGIMTLFLISLLMEIPIRMLENSWLPSFAVDFAINF